MESEELKKAYLIVYADKQKKRDELCKAIINFNEHLSKLISATPTGEERNNYTDINIMFLDIVDKFNHVQK